MEYVVNAGVEQLSAAMTGSNEMEIKGSVGLDAICFAPCETESVMECEVEEYEENEFLKFPSIIGISQPVRKRSGTSQRNTTPQSILLKTATTFLQTAPASVSNAGISCC